MSETQVKIEKVSVENIGGDLRLRGDEGEEGFRIKADMPSIQRDDDTGTMRVTTAGDCDLRIPSQAAIEVGNVGGDAKLTYFSQPMTVSNIGGDLVLRNTRNVKLTTVNGDLSARYVEDGFEVQTVRGDMEIRHVEGTVDIQNVGSDLSVRNVAGSVKTHHVGGDILVDLDFEPGKTYEFHAGGDIAVSLHPDMNVTFVLPSAKANYEVDDLGEEFSVNVEKTDEQVQIKVGFSDDDRVTVLADAGNVFYLSDKSRRRGRFFNFQFNFEPPEPPEPPVPPQFGDFDIKIGDEPLGMYISRTVNEQMERVSEDLGELGKNWGAFGERIAEKAERQAERAARRAERHAERAARRAGKHDRGRGHHEAERRRAERERRRAERIHERQMGYHRGESEVVAPVSDEERMMILNMLEEGQISVEEAERLLSTMEGKKDE